MAAAAEWIGSAQLESGAGGACPASASLDGVEVERRCAAQAPARACGPVRRVLAALAGRMQSLRGWERLGYTRAGDYTRECLGFSARELSDLARVDTALRTLPRLEAALVAGELPWTKVRLISRAARPEEEAKWIAFARRVSVRQLEGYARTIDAESVEGGGGEPDEEDEGRRQGVAMMLRSDTQARWQLGWRLVRRVAGEALEPGACAEYIAAEVLSALPGVPEDESVAPRGLAFQERRGARWRQRDTPARSLRALFERMANEADDGSDAEGGSAPLPAFLRDLVEGLESADAAELDARLRRAVALEQRLEAELGPLLVRVASRRLYLLRGFSGLERYAAERLGISARKAWALLRIERAGRRCPALLAAYREGLLSWVGAQVLVAIVKRAPAHVEAWIACARRVCVRRLRDDVDRALLLADADPETFAETGGVPDLDAELACESDEEAARLQTRANTTDPRATHAPEKETSRAFFTAPRDVARLFRASVATVRRRIGPKATLSDALDAMLEHCFEAWGARDPKRKREYRIFIVGRARTRFVLPLAVYAKGDVLVSA